MHVEGAASEGNGYSGLFRNKKLLNKKLDPRFASSAILSLALSVSQKVQGPKAPDQDPEEKCHSVIRDQLFCYALWRRTPGGCNLMHICNGLRGRGGGGS